MIINRLAYGSFKEDELIFFAEGCGEEELLVNMAFFAKLKNGLKVKVKYFHNEYTGNELGLEVYIINPSTGNTMDMMLMRFDYCIGSPGGSCSAQISGGRWDMEIMKSSERKLERLFRIILLFGASDIRRLFYFLNNKYIYNICFSLFLKINAAGDIDIFRKRLEILFSCIDFFAKICYNIHVRKISHESLLSLLFCMYNCHMYTLFRVNNERPWICHPGALFVLLFLYMIIKTK